MYYRSIKERLTDRIYAAVLNGDFSINAYLFPSERKKMLSKGFTVTILDNMSNPNRSVFCAIAWDHPAEDSLAYDFYIVASRK